MDSGQSNMDRDFIGNLFEDYAKKSLETLSEIFIGEDADRVQELTVIELNTKYPQGHVLPTLGYEAKSEVIFLHIEPDSIIDYCNKIVEEVEADDIEAPDIAKMLVGAGAARVVMARKAAALPTANPENTRQYQEKICDKTKLWELAADYGDDNGVQLRGVVEKMGDDVFPQVNVVRFVIGASLNYLTDVHELQIRVPEMFREILAEEETERANNLTLNVACLGSESAYAIYDDSVSPLLWGLSFPMSPAEELTSFFAQTL